MLSGLRQRLKPFYQPRIVDAARLYRSTLRRPVFIGITGSCGKTTAKDLTAAVLSSTFSGRKSFDSGNGPPSTSRTILGLLPWSDFCVQEVGANKPGSLDSMLGILRPRIGVVLNIGSDHRTGFRSLEATAQEKGKLVEVLPAEGIAILNADDPLVAAMASRTAARVITFGRSPEADVRAEAISSVWPSRLTFTLLHEKQSLGVQTLLCGEHWVPSVLAAIATGLALGVPLATGVAAVELVEPFTGRMRPEEDGAGVTFLCDDWKASWWSLPAALEFLRTARAARKILVFGTISDYKGKARRRYPELARDALDAADHVIFAGPNAHSARHARPDGDPRLTLCATVREAAEFVDRLVQPGDLVMLKSSQADHLQRVLLARRGEIRCWREQCGRAQFCTDCRLRMTG